MELIISNLNKENVPHPNFTVSNYKLTYSEKLHHGSVADVCPISENMFVSIAQDRNLILWHYDSNQKVSHFLTFYIFRQLTIYQNLICKFTTLQV